MVDETPRGKDAVTGTQSVDRALSLLGAFTEEHPQRRIAELVDESGLGQSTVSRLVSALVAAGYLTIDRNGLYTIGRQPVKLAAIRLNQSIVHKQARQLAQELAADLGLGVNVAERADASLYYLCHFEGVGAPRSITMIGHGGPLHATGLGKVLISELSDAERTALLGPEPYPGYTRRTITRKADLDKELARVHERGYTMEVEELALRRACVAAPIRDRSGVIVAALSISGPMSVIRPEERESELAMRAIEAADQVSTELGYRAAGL
jgi:DNA-binding IclR family transcriptional regulator